MGASAIPGYTLKKKLGEGAMASVYLAEDDSLHRKVALKVMSKKLLADASFVDRFLREARIVASISHRNIVTVFDVGSHNNHHYMAMELLPGGDMSAKLRDEMPLDKAISYVIDIAEGLQYAGSKNLIHRDIKPDNIMFAEDGRAVITDFGIARDASSESNMTVVGSVIGTPQYMSPEQAGAKELDHRTDLYSLGIILYQILVGRPPFKGDSAISTGIMHINEPVPVLPARYEQFQQFIDKALAKHPDERFQSGTEFIDALSKVSLEEPEDDSAATLIFTPEASSEKLDVMTDLSEEFLEDIDSSDAVSPETDSSSEDDVDLDSLSVDLPIDDESNDSDPASKGGSLSLMPDSTAESESDSSSDSAVSKPATRRSAEKKVKKEPTIVKEPISFPIAKVLTLLLVLFIGTMGGHIYYVNVLGKQVQFTGAAIKLTNLSVSTFGSSPNFYRVSDMLTSTSISFGKFTDRVLGDSLPKKDKINSY